MPRRDGFTLLEMVIALVIGLLLITLAVPGIVGLLRERDLQRTFESFDALVRSARDRSVSESRGFRIVFNEEGATLEPSAPQDSDEGVDVEHYQLNKGETLTVDRPAAMVKKPLAEWPFWRSGCCEPVLVNYTGPAGSWTAKYDPLTGRGAIVDQDVK
jgi:prepilin-type N-terminal cleavage/methylation domain-containing protein